MSKHHNKTRREKKSRSKSVASNVSQLSGSSNEEFVVPAYDPKEINYKVKTSKLMGRYIVATKDLKIGSIIIKERPLVVGPCAGSNLQCLGCYHPIEGKDDHVKCKNCGWLLCSYKCKGLYKQHGHTKTECDLLRDTHSCQHLEYDDFDKLKENLYAIVPLRCLLLKETDPKSYERLIDMETHDDIRRNIPDIWETNQRVIVDRIRDTWNLKRYDEAEIHSVCGILEVNAFEIGQQGINIRGLYPTAFLLSHDCVPNTSHYDEETSYNLTVRASTHIPENYPITLSYAHTLQDTSKRREHLLENKFFECCCKRCKDPTELGTYASALICPKCKIGPVLPTNPLTSDTSWSCTNNTNGKKSECPGYTVTAKSMRLLIERITEEVNAIDCNDIDGMEKFLEKYRNVLYPSHYLCLGVKLSLSQLYGKINGYIIHELSDELLLRKQTICKEILKIFDVIEPGFSRLRGVTLYELHAPIMILTTRLFERQLLNKNELRTRLKEVVRYLEEASVILSFEGENSSEGIMGGAAKEALVRIKDWGKIIGKM